MSTNETDIEALVAKKYEHGFITDIESETFEPGLDENIIRRLSKLKGEPQFMLDWRLKSFAIWKKMRQPNWAKLNIEPID